MARHATLLGHHGPRHSGQPVLQYSLAQNRILHTHSPHRWLLRLSDPYGYRETQANTRLCSGIYADEKQLSPQKATSTDVWTKFNNEGGWPTQALSVFVGLIGSVFANNGKQHSSLDKGLRSMTDAASKVPTAPYM